MVPSWANQLLPQLLMEQFDTLPIQCGHIEHMHEGVYIFFCTDSTEIFSKFRSAGLNYNLPSFSLNLNVRGVSNEHCLVTFFIVPFPAIHGNFLSACSSADVLWKLIYGPRSDLSLGAV